MRNIITTNSSIDTITFNTKSETTFSTDAPSTINSINVSPDFINIIKLEGDYTDSIISIETNCILICDDDFICRNPITFAKDNLNIFIAGNFSNCPGLVIDKNVKMSTYEDVTSPLSNLQVYVKENSNAYLLGDLKDVSVTLENNSSLSIDGVLKSLGSTNINNNINLNLSYNKDVTQITQVNNLSNINLSGDNVAINTFLNKYPTLENTTLITSSSYMTTFTAGESTIPIIIPKKGNFKIKAFVINDDKEYILDSSVVINIIS